MRYGVACPWYYPLSRLPPPSVNFSILTSASVRLTALSLDCARGASCLVCYLTCGAALGIGFQYERHRCSLLASGVASS